MVSEENFVLVYCLCSIISTRVIAARPGASTAYKKVKNQEHRAPCHIARISKMLGALGSALHAVDVLGSLKGQCEVTFALLILFGLTYHSI